MKVLLLLALVGACAANRAFPIDSQDYAVALFQKINPYIVWDDVNYLVDLSGPHANCDVVGTRGGFNVQDITKQGFTIGGLRDYTRGERTDSGAVKEYIRDLLNPWITDRQFLPQIENAERFGCSVRPGCSGYVVVACLFSPAYSGDQPTQPTQPTPPPFVGEQRALAFTDDQYAAAERITGFRWDRSHFLENLSGFETRCEMIMRPNWRYDYAKQEAGRRGMLIETANGYAMNRGDTGEALNEILSNLSALFTKFSGSRLGCSTIPDCDVEGTMFVVVSCIFEL